ncbi:2-aminoethylphosphonate-pyruvate transaminase [Bacillus pakistanensis]|uniref:2-aminoethylphosphonate--pyruvate transaminase n=1 Tax=Rossellomorea pakistanensis TaxID=992288 RepID=A0ABS2NGS2_9BACI|nr:2-aminoethylphosphonate--pyruvate transaminase [Bacillus pakistanensis]MBM7587005.1 2-aminoethylphosphonate-pyruvate transaminase [Bacillus pakistanensis]
MNNPYLLLTPGPLSTSDTVRSVMQKDWCTWDDEYLQLVQTIRKKLVVLATHQHIDYTAVLMQGSGTFTVESVIGSVIPKEKGKLLVATNGAYGTRIVKIASMLNIPVVTLQKNENELITPIDVENVLLENPDITHVAVVHCETTTGILNPVEKICHIAKNHGKVTIVDAMSSFGGIEIDVHEWHIDFLISSANKCIQGVPGFGFVIAKKEEIESCKGHARSLSLDLYDQWNTMEEFYGKWRFTSPTHTVRAFYQALLELEKEGGIQERNHRYKENQTLLVDEMKKMGFQAFIDHHHQSPIITSFLYPDKEFNFPSFYQYLKEKGFVIYPGKVSEVQTFRIGNIGEVYPDDIKKLVDSIKEFSTKKGTITL